MAVCKKQLLRWWLPGFVGLLAVLFGLALALPGSATAAPGDPRPLCKVCRRFWDTSETRVVFALRFKRIERMYQVCSLFGYCEFMEDYPDMEPERVQIVNYATLGNEFEQMLNATRSYYLFEAEGDDNNNAPPHVYAFRSEDEAKAYQKDLGGELMDWEGVIKELAALAEEYEPEPPRQYDRLRLR